VLEGVDLLFHLASHRRNITYHREHRGEMIAKNMELTEGMIDALRRHGPVPSVFFSTALVGTVADQSIDSISDGYLAAKIECEKLWTAAASGNGFPLLVVRPASAYGPRDRFGTDANMIPSLIVRCSEAEKELSVWGSGKQRRSFVYAPDVAEATIKLLHAKATGVQYICPPSSGSSDGGRGCWDYSRSCAPGLAACIRRVETGRAGFSGFSGASRPANIPMDPDSRRSAKDNRVEAAVTTIAVFVRLECGESAQNQPDWTEIRILAIGCTG
jgi:hypothetical protein